MLAGIRCIGIIVIAVAMTLYTPKPLLIREPAKMSPSLCFRILEHLKELGLLKEGDKILDPMGGTGITAICAGAKGYKAVTVELEEKFVGFQQANHVYASRKLYKDLDWTILQGDARHLSELLTERGMITVSSPPYAEAQSGGGIFAASLGEGSYNVTTSMPKPTYAKELHGTSPGQIGNLKDTPLKTVTSPPYGDQETPLNQQGKGNNHDHNRGLSVGRHYLGQAREGQIGQEKQSSYLSEMRRVYAEIAKVSDVLACVLKNPTRNGKLRRLDLDSIAILKETGWKIACAHRSLLFEELEQADLFEGSRKRVKGRLSFFKRLSWQKGSPVASWEDVIIAVRA